MTSRKETSLGKKLIKVPFTISTRLTDRAHIMEEQKNDPSLSTEVENLSQTSQSNDNRPPQNEDSPQTSQSNDDRLPLDERRPCNNFKLPAFWKHNAGSWIALIEAKFRMSEITTQINKYMAVLEALSNSELEHLYNIPKPEDENCYDKLITQIYDIFTRDDQDRLDLLLNDLTLDLYCVSSTQQTNLSNIFISKIPKDT